MTQPGKAGMYAALRARLARPFVARRSSNSARNCPTCRSANIVTGDRNHSYRCRSCGREWRVARSDAKGSDFESPEGGSSWLQWGSGDNGDAGDVLE